MRTIFLVDGFNLYHSVAQASYDLNLNGAGTKWLNIRSLCSSYLHLIDRAARLEEIYYFSAFAKYMRITDPGVLIRHETLIECYESLGIKVVLGRYKRRTVKCKVCGRRYAYHEEKETDVAISIKVLELLFTGKCDTVVLMTGDTDVAPAVRTAHHYFPQNHICFTFPYKRSNKELKALVSKHWTIDGVQYQQHQFPDPFIAPDGRQINKPSTW